MSVSALSRQSFFQPYSAANSFQQIQGQFQELGQDLKSGNLAQAQQDFAALTAAFSSEQQSTNNTNGSSNTNGITNSSTTSTTTTTNPIASDFGTLGQALRSGNISAAQQAYSSVQQDVQQSMTRHHHQHMGTANGSGSGEGNSLMQALSQIGQALQTGSTAAAQQAYSAIQGQMAEFAWDGGMGGGGTSLAAAGVNLLA